MVCIYKIEIEQNKIEIVEEILSKQKRNKQEEQQQQQTPIPSRVTIPLINIIMF
jgi:hypothetical protein